MKFGLTKSRFGDHAEGAPQALEVDAVGNCVPESAPSEQRGHQGNHPMCRRRPLLRFFTGLTAAAIGAASVGVAPAAAAPQVDTASPAPQFFGTASGWSYRGSVADASASTLLSSRGSSGVVLLFCEGSRIGFHFSLGTTDRRSLSGAEDGLLQVYAADDPPAASHKEDPKLSETARGEGRHLHDEGAHDEGAGDEDIPDQEHDREAAVEDISGPGTSESGTSASGTLEHGLSQGHASLFPDRGRGPPLEADRLLDLPLLAQFRIRFFSDFEFRSLPLRQPEWDSPDTLLEVIRDHSGGLRLVFARLRQNRFTSTRMADLYLPDDSDGSGLPKETALAFLERDCRTGLKSEDINADDEAPG
jgi:hypothetical protein